MSTVMKKKEIFSGHVKISCELQEAKLHEAPGMVCGHKVRTSVGYGLCLFDWNLKE